MILPQGDLTGRCLCTSVLVLMKRTSVWHEEMIDLLRLASQNRNLMDALLEDLCTPEELQAIERRWQIIKYLYKDTPQREIREKLGVAIATVTRGSRMLKNPNGGFARLIHMILTTKHPTRLTQAWRKQLME